MKISIYTTLLLTFFLISQSGSAQTQKDKNYKRFYKSVNQDHGKITVYDQKKIQNPDEIIEVITVAELDSVMKNMAGVTDIIRGGKSILHPVITLELDPHSSAAQALFGCDEPLDRVPDVGKGVPEPKIPGIPMVKKVTVPAPEKPAIAEAKPATPAPAVTKPATPSTSQPMVKEPVIAKPATGPELKPAEKPTSSTPGFNNAWKLLRSVPVELMNESDRAQLRKYSIVVGTFRSLNNAEFVKRTFNGLGERGIIVKNSETGLYYTVVGGHDSNVEAIQKLEEFTKKYTEGQSRARRISRYGIPLDDLWILIHE